MVTGTLPMPVYVYMYTLHIILTVCQHPQIQIILKLIDFSLLLWGKIGSMWLHEAQRVRDWKHIIRNIGRLAMFFFLFLSPSPSPLYFHITGFLESTVDPFKQSTTNWISMSINIILHCYITLYVLKQTALCKFTLPFNNWPKKMLSSYRKISDLRLCWADHSGRAD